MHIYSVTDPEFKSYGRVWDDVPSNLTAPLVEALSATPIPEGSKYVASAPELEQVEGADTLGLLMYGGRPFQLGWCNGHNTKLNCLEYHRASEFNLGARDFILLLAKREQIVDGKLDTTWRQGLPRAGRHARRGLCYDTPLHALHGRRLWLPGDGCAARRHQRPAPRGCSRYARRR